MFALSKVSFRHGLPIVAAATFVLAAVNPLRGARAADDKKKDVTFALAVHVARDGKDPVANDAWIDAQIARAEALFGPVGVHFKRGASSSLPGAFTRLEDRDDRDGLAGELAKGKINVMIVGSLRDVDDPTLVRQGVHWHARKTPAKHYVIVASYAGTTVLAHELGHFFGNPHTTIKDNLMSYDRSGADVFLDDAQKKKITAFAGIYRQSKELVAE